MQVSFSVIAALGVPPLFHKLCGFLPLGPFHRGHVNWEWVLGRATPTGPSALGLSVPRPSRLVFILTCNCLQAKLGFPESSSGQSLLLTENPLGSDTLFGQPRTGLSLLTMLGHLLHKSL